MHSRVRQCILIDDIFDRYIVIYNRLMHDLNWVNLLAERRDKVPSDVHVDYCHSFRYVNTLYQIAIK